MYEYIIGKIRDIFPTYIVLENNNIGYLIVVSNPYFYKINEEFKVYIHQYLREDINTLYGFKDKAEKDLFLKLISVNGIGPKSALSILAVDKISDVVDAIELGNTKFLMKFPGIGLKASQQIILDLKGKLILDETKILNDGNKDDLELALLTLGYKKAEITKAIKNLDLSKSLDELLKQALQNMLK